GNVPYNSPQYTATSPLPGPVYNPNNVPAALDPLTGELTFTSFTGGSYILALKTTSYRCGVLIAEVTREIQVSILPNALPDYPLTTMVPNYPPEIQFQGVGGGPAVTTLPVWAGDYLEFDLIAFDTLPPLLLAPAGVPNGMTLQAAGMDFGTGFSSDSSGCPYPPCATLDPSPDSINAMPNFLVLTTRFSWQTDCSHVGGNCGAPQSLHAFNFQLADVACPVPASSSHTFTVLVRNPILDPPQLHTLAALPGPGLKLAWSPPDTSQIPFYFYGYYIYHATSANGPFTLLDSLPSFMDTTYVVNITGTGDHGFMIRTRSGCDGQAYSSPSDTLWDFLVRRDEEVKDKDHAPAFLQVGPGGDLAFRVTEAGYYALELHTLQGQCLRRVPSRYYAEGDHRLDWVSGLPARAIYLATAISQGHAVHSKVLLR
ncbi:MAG TPA: hypothetical protein P5248_07005, partial [Bacteroidales bacterium]|nr:hypothetical protein [Bacteroidales bacterium]